jgi:SPP1 family phage portal protein
MFTVDKNTELNKDLVEEAIKYNNRERERYTKLKNYYLSKHDILNRKKPLGSKNTKVVTNHAKYITDINVGFLLGNPVTYKVLDEGIKIDDILIEYDQQTISDLDTELEYKLSKFGKAYELIYNDGNSVRSKDVDPRNAICIYDNTVEHNKLFGIVYQLKSSTLQRGLEDLTIYSDREVWRNCVTKNGEIAIGESEVHAFGKVPLVEFKNNSEGQGDYEQVIPLIDAYNILQSDRINDKQQLVEAILLGYGIELTPEQREDLQNSRMIFGLPPKGEAVIDYLSKSLDESQIDILRKNIEDDIHKISLTPNMSDENFVGNSSGVAIAYKLLPFMLNLKNKERLFETGLMERLEIYNNYLQSISKGTKLEIYKVDAVFKRTLPQNLLEISQIVNNLRGIVDDETLVSQIPFVENPKDSIEKAKEEGLHRFVETTSGFGTGEPNEAE